MILCLHPETCDHFSYLLFSCWNFQYLYAVIWHLLEHHEIDMMAFVARCFSLAFSSLFLHVLTHRFDFMCSWLCVIFGVLTLLKATYASLGLNLSFAGVISIRTSDSVSPWHLCIVTVQANVNGNWVLVA